MIMRGEILLSSILYILCLRTLSPVARVNIPAGELVTGNEDKMLIASLARLS